MGYPIENSMCIPTMINTKNIHTTNKFKHVTGSYVRLERVGDGDKLDRVDDRNKTRQHMIRRENDNVPYKKRCL